MNEQDKNRMGGQHSGGSKGAEKTEKKEQGSGQHQQGHPDNRDRKDDMRREPQQGQRDQGDHKREQR